MNQAMMNSQNKFHDLQSNLERAQKAAERRASKSDNPEKIMKL